MTVNNSFDKKLFWDVDPEKLNWQPNSQFIIERVLLRGFTKDVRTLFNLYTKGQLSKEITWKKVKTYLKQTFTKSF
jgi:hypothetical protein